MFIAFLEHRGWRGERGRGEGAAVRRGGRANLVPRPCWCVHKRQRSEGKARILQPGNQECRTVPAGVKNILQECQDHKELIIRHPPRISSPTLLEGGC